jgi:hypothetical protein
MSKATERARLLAEPTFLNAEGDPHKYIGELRATIRKMADYIEALEPMVDDNALQGWGLEEFEEAKRKFEEAVK